MDQISIQLSDARWRSRSVTYYKGNWAAIQKILPDFELLPFSAADGEPANPYLRVVMRKPMNAAERSIPVGAVSHSYTLVPHRTIAQICRQGVVEAVEAPDDLQYEVGLSELGEWMNFRIYFPERYGFTDEHGKKLALRLECFNSVDGSSCLLIVFGWLRFVCSNGLIIGKSMIRIRERHGEMLDIASIPKKISKALQVAESDKDLLKAWQFERVTSADIAPWVDGKLADAWGVKAATRVFHICNHGRDVSLANNFAPGSATEKPVVYRKPVPGSPPGARTKYDVSQALSHVASGRRNADEQVSFQLEIPELLAALPSRALALT